MASRRSRYSDLASGNATIRLDRVLRIDGHEQAIADAARVRLACNSTTPFLSGTILAEHDRTGGQKIEIGEIGLLRRATARRVHCLSPAAFDVRRLARWNSSPAWAICSPVSVLRIAHGFNSKLGRSSMLPGYLWANLRSMM